VRALGEARQDPRDDDDTSGPWARLQAHFDALVDLPPAERALSLAAIPDPELRQEVAELLAVDDGHAAPARLDWVGPYRLSRILGSGGMGVVYLAHRDVDGVPVPVAVKLLPWVARGLVRRFHEERRILSTLNHPHITRLLDGGTLPDGRPYLVMEYVDGVPLLDHAARSHLGIPARLALFRQVCAGVHHAHQRGVIHRDIKPSNVLVDALGQVKLLDFGVAKVTRGAAPAEPLTTPTSPVGLTPEYASPEQLRDGEVTTASDVYGLGALLFELLAGQRPTPARADGPVPTRERRPSRHAPTAELRRRLAGDLDVIVEKAMAEEPGRRFPSAQALSEDLRRHLEGLPVEARGASAGYVLWRFVRRHPWSSAGAAGSLAALVALTVGLAVQTRRLERQRDEAQRTVAFASDLVWDVVGQDASGRPRDTLALLDARVARLEEELGDAPGVKAQLRGIFGLAYVRIHAEERGIAHLKAALADAKAAFPDAPERHLLAASRLGHSYFLMGRLDEAAGAYAVALEASRRYHGPEAKDTADLLNSVGGLAFIRGRFDEAEAVFSEAYALRQATLPPTDPALAQSLLNLGEVQCRLGHHEAGLALLERTLELRDRNPEATSPRVAEVALARCLADAGRAERARAVMAHALSGLEAEGGLIQCLTHLAQAYVEARLGGWATAGAALDRAEPGLAEQGAQLPWLRLEATQIRGWIRAAQGDEAGAMEARDEARRQGERLGIALADPPVIRP
jgi:tetratricopeptide (TPR) repeat protein